MTNDNNENHVMIGLMMISTEGPSFGTPIFRGSTSLTERIQYSKHGIKIEKFVDLPFAPSATSDFRQILSNKPYDVNSDFLYAYIDIEGNKRTGNKEEICKDLVGAFHLYAGYPFFQWMIIRMSNNKELLRRLTPMAVIELHRGLLRADTYSPQTIVEAAPTTPPPKQKVFAFESIMKGQNRNKKFINQYLTEQFVDIIPDGAHKILHVSGHGMIEDQFTNLSGISIDNAKIAKSNQKRKRRSKQSKYERLQSLYDGAASGNNLLGPQFIQLESYFEIVRDEII